MKKIVLLLSLSLFMLALAACGGAPAEEAGDAVNNGGTNNPTADGSGTRSIVVTTHQTNLILGEERLDDDGNTHRDPDFAFLAHLAEVFTAETGIEVILETAHTADQLRSLLMVGDSSFDVISNGHELNITEMQQWLYPVMTLDEAIEIYGEGNARAMFGAEGAVFGVATGMAYSFGVSYNRAVIQAAGFDEIPGNLEEFNQLLQNIQDLGITPISLHRIENWPMGTIGDVAEHIYGRRDVRERALLLDDPFSPSQPLGQALQLYTGWKSAGFFEQEMYPNFGAAMDSVPHGAAGMMLFGSWVTPQLIGRIPADTPLDVIQFDAGPDFGAGRVIPAAPMHEWFINGASENVEYGRMFIDFIARSPEYLSKVGVIATHRDVEPVIPEIFQIVDRRIRDGEVRVMYAPPRDENFMHWESVMREANLLADDRWAGLPFDTYDVTRPGEWDAFYDQLTRQNADFAWARDDLGVTFIE